MLTAMLTVCYAPLQEILGPEHSTVQLSISRVHNATQVGEPIIIELVRMRPGTIPPDATGIAKLISDGNARTRGGGAAAEEVQLPPGWVQETDPSSGRVYYVNHTLKTFSWARPSAEAKQ